MSTIILTGANGNLGPTVARRLLKDGYRIIATIGSHGSGELTEGHMFEIKQVDLMNGSQTREFIKSVINQYPDLQAAVLLVGGFAMGNLSEISEEMLNKMIRLNFLTAFNMVRNLLPFFLDRPEGGQFVLMGSRPGLNPKQGKNFFGYTISKSMVFSLADIINTEGKDKNVSATVIVPSIIDTKENRQNMPEADFSNWVPADVVADTISFTLSETGRMMRETVIKIYNKS